MLTLIVKTLISAAIIVAVSEIAGRYPRVGGLVLTLPVVSIIAFVMTWTKQGEMGTITTLARETLVLVPLGLPFFVPFAVANRTGLSFWPSFALGLVLASLTIGAWFQFGPSPTEEPAVSQGRSGEHAGIDSDSPTFPSSDLPPRLPQQPLDRLRLVGGEDAHVEPG